MVSRLGKLVASYYYYCRYDENRPNPLANQVNDSTVMVAIVNMKPRA